MDDRKIRVFSTVVMVLFGLFLIYYLHRSLGQLLPFALIDLKDWENHWMVRGVVTIPLWWRICYVAVWSVSISATVVMILTAIRLVNLVRQGVYFELATIKALQWVGGCAVVAGATIIGANSLWPWMITFFNETERRPIRFGYDSSEAGVVLLGAGIFLLAWVLKYAVLLKNENEEFV